MGDFYGLNYSIKSFAVANDFTVFTNKACYKLGQQLKPFCIYANEEQEKHGVVDFSKFSAFLNPEISLVDEIAMYRKGLYEESGLYLDSFDDTKKKLLFFDYLMSISICYVEVPKYITKNGVATPSFDKFLCTKNPAIMGAWMGCSPNEMQAKYSAKIASNITNFSYNELRCVKLNHSSKGNSITVPRSAYNTEKMSCIPLYMLYAFVEGFKPVINEGIVKFSFLKDNGTVRELCTTLNSDILHDYYSDDSFVRTMLSGVDINTVEQGGMMLSSKMNRGYIKVPELGSSVYDETGVRSLNIARLLSAEQISEVDRTFINVDLNSVVYNFETGMDYMLQNLKDAVVPCYKELAGDDFNESNCTTLVGAVESAKEYVRGRSIFLSTEYHRSLHKFMIFHPEWFPQYTGRPAQQVVSSKNYGVAEMDF